MTRTHQRTTSNTLSALSCATDASELSGGGEGEACPAHWPAHRTVSQDPMETPSPDPEPGLPAAQYRLNDVFYSEYGSDPDTDPKLDRLDSPAHSGPGVWQVGRGRGRKQDTAISMETDTGFEEVLDPGHQKLPGEPLKALVSLLFLGVSWVANTSSLALTHEFVPTYDPLPDIVLDNITYQSWALDVCEILLMLSIVAAVLVVVFHRHRLVLVRRVWFLLALLYFYRSLTIFVTVLPKSDAGYKCSEKAGNITAILVVNRVVTILSGGGLSINGKHVYCGDYIFSGHTVIFVMAYLCIKQYTPPRCYPLHWLSLLTSVCGVIFLLLARGHYTIDVVIAYALTYWLWITYHTLANVPFLKSRHRDNQLKGLLWWHVLRWFEAKVPGAVPNEYSVPCWGLLRKLWRRCQSPPLQSCTD